MLNVNALLDHAEHNTLWTIRRFRDDAHFKNWVEAGEPDKGRHAPEVPGLPGISKIEGNVLLNEGIAVLQTLLIGTGGTVYSNGVAYLGVGSDATAEGPTDTGLIDGTPTFKSMEATYPQIAGQVTTWRAVFASGDANEAWEEFTVVNASSDTGDNLNRKTSSQGTKTVGQTWTLDLAITWS